MRTIKPQETELVGTWFEDHGKPKADAVCERIERLIKDYLQPVAEDPPEWSTLYVDPADGRFWELTYPHGEMHGGGPPRLAVVSRQDASFRYDLRNLTGR